jgi:hypothetical protein
VDVDTIARTTKKEWLEIEFPVFGRSCHATPDDNYQFTDVTFGGRCFEVLGMG